MMKSLLPANFGRTVADSTEDAFLAELGRIEKEDSIQALRELLRLTIPTVSGPPLAWAVESGFLRAASCLLRAGASVGEGIQAAILTDDPRFLHMLFSETLTLRTELTARWQSPFGSYLAEAARRGSRAVLAVILEYAELPRTFDPLFTHHTMCAAAEGGNVECIQLLASSLRAACGVEEALVYTAHRHTLEPVKTKYFSRLSLLSAAIVSTNIDTVELVLRCSGPDRAAVLADLEGPCEATDLASDTLVPVLRRLLEHREVCALAARGALNFVSLSSALRVGHPGLTALLLDAQGPDAGPLALTALRAGVTSGFVFGGAKATPGSAADDDLRQTVDALLCALPGGVPLAQLRAGAADTTIARLRRALVSGQVADMAADTAISADDTDLQAAVDAEVGWCFAQLPGKGVTLLPKPLVELLLALTLPTAPQSMRSHMSQWRAALRLLVHRLHDWSPRTELISSLPTPAMLDKPMPRMFSGGFYTVEPPTRRAAANMNAVHRRDGSAYHAPEPLAPLHFPPAEALLGDGSCPVCRSTGTDCVPYCIALRSREDIADAELVRAVLAAAPDAATSAALLADEAPDHAAPGRTPAGLLAVAVHALKPTVLGELLRAGADPATVLSDHALAAQTFRGASKVEAHALMYQAPYTVCLRLLRRAFGDSDGSGDGGGDSWVHTVTKIGPDGYSPLLAAAARADPCTLRFFSEHSPGGLAALMLMRDGQPVREPVPLMFNISSTRPYAMAMIEADAKTSVEAAFSLVVAATRQACADCSASPAAAELLFARLLHGIALNDAGQQAKQATSPIRIVIVYKHPDAYTTAVLLLREGSCYGTELSRDEGTFLHMFVTQVCQSTLSGYAKAALRTLLAGARSSAQQRARFSALLKLP
jgi:hypothetical protein